jgi:uncharacterized protein YbbC (DUF1343 family)
MARCLNATALLGVPFVILDRVNPVGARERDIQGPVLGIVHSESWLAFVVLCFFFPFFLWFNDLFFPHSFFLILQT